MLENYCQQWDLNINHCETNVMIFNKKRSSIKNRKIFVGGKAIKKVVNHKYLGLKVMSSGKKIHVGGSTGSYQQSLKGMVSIQNCCSVKRKKILKCVKLFDSAGRHTGDIIFLGSL